MNKYAFLTKPARKNAEIAESYGRFSAANAQHCEPRAFYRVNRYRSLREKSFSLTVRADDGSTLLETHVEYMHQAFQRLIDWSIEEVDRDVCAVITGPNGFYTKHRIKASRDFSLDATVAAGEKPRGRGVRWLNSEALPAVLGVLEFVDEGDRVVLE